MHGSGLGWWMTAVCVVVMFPISAIGQMHESNPAAAKALEDIIKAHRAPSGIDIETRLQVGAGDGEQEAFESDVVARWIIGPDRAVRGEFGGYTIQTGNGKITALHEAREGLFYSDEDGESPYYAVQQRFIDLPWPVLALAIGEDDPNDVAMQLHTRSPWLQPTAVRERVVDDRTVGELELQSDYEDMVLNFDPTTFHLISAEIRIHSGPFVKDDVELIYRYSFTTRSLEGDVAPKIALDLNGRQRADSLAAIARPSQPKGGGRSAPKADAGQPAPALSLPGYEGGTISLEKLKGRMVVVDFWATWCAPCIKELPYFEVLDQREDVEVLLVSLDFPKHKYSRLLPFVDKNKLQSKIVHLDDKDENYWINDIDPNWSGALPATLIFTKKQRGFYEQSFTASKLDKILKLFKP